MMVGMDKSPTHYANLNVSQDAPMEVIDAAYKALCKKYHPDLNRNNPEAARRMATVNASYDVLSDYGKRYLYDKQLSDAAKEAARKAEAAKPKPQPSYTPPPRQPQQQKRPSYTFPILRNVIKGILRPLLVVLFLYWFFIPHNFGTLKHPQVTDAPRVYTRPLIAPNGAEWPSAASYIAGYPIKNVHGVSTVTIDNSKNDADVFVKLFEADGTSEKPVRVLYIPHASTFVLRDVSPARYTVQYKDLDSGNSYETAPFDLIEKTTMLGRNGRNVKMILYKVAYNISVSEF